MSSRSKVNIEDFISRCQKQKEFIGGKGNLLVFTWYFKEGWFGSEYNLNDEILENKAYELGIDRVKNCIQETIVHREIGDDFISSINPGHWGSGFKVAIFNEAGLKWGEGTSFQTEYTLDTYEKLDKLKFNLSNKWVKILSKYWEGVENAFTQGILLTAFVPKSPLDLANGIRGNEIFMDMYDNPKLLDKLLDFCVDSIIKLDSYLRNNISIINSEPNGAFGVHLPGKVIWMNGDPIDLISVEMGDRFNKPSVEKVSEYAESIFFHHHSIGYERIRSVSNIKGVVLQNIEQDPVGPKLFDIIDKDLIEISHKQPIDFMANLADLSDPEKIIKKLSEGRFILHVNSGSLDEIKYIVNLVKKYSNF